MEKSKIEVRDLKDLDFEILNEGDLSHIRGGNVAPSKPASTDATSGTLPTACDGAS